MKRREEHGVADVGACGVRDRRGHAGIGHGLRHRMDGQRGEVRVRGALQQTRSPWPRAVVIGDARVRVVDAHELRRHLSATARLAKAEHDGGILALDRRKHGSRPAAKRHGDSLADHGVARDGRGECACHLPRGVRPLSPKGLEARNQDLLHTRHLSCATNALPGEEPAANGPHGSGDPYDARGSVPAKWASAARRSRAERGGLVRRQERRAPDLRKLCAHAPPRAHVGARFAQLVDTRGHEQVICRARARRAHPPGH